ncbi:MAG: S9 family peptidase, partial [Cyclobacteriaceae bacterium]|nr:S9 family peptidase [Cyclobacteriaceae bacterium]
MKNITPPIAKKIPFEITTHDHMRTDDYFWMRLSDEQKLSENPDEQTKEVFDYLNTENQYTKAKMLHTKGFQEKLYNEIVGRIKKDDESVPYKSNGYWYYTRVVEGKEYTIYCRKERTLEADEEIILDTNELAEGHDFFQLGGISISEDNAFLAYSVDTVSRRKYTVYFKNLITGEILNTTIPNTTGGCTWANDNKTVFYTTKDEQTLRSDKVHKHVLGTDFQTDKLVFHEKDEAYYSGIYKSKSKKYLVIYTGSTLTNQYFLLEADRPNDEFREFNTREEALEYSVAHFEDKFYVVTNWNAKNFRLMETPENATGKSNWKEVIPHREEVLLEGIELFKNHLIVEERKNGLTELRVINQKSGEEHYLEFDDPAYTAYSGTNPEFDTDVFRFGYTSMSTPSSVFDYNMNVKKKVLLKQHEIVGGYNASMYVTERHYAPSRDGVKIPISLVYKKGMKKDGKSPLLLYGYGSYGANIDPYFSSVRLSLLDRGFVYAIAHIRGSQTMGRQWYEDGKMFNKKNTFYDFIDCGEYLINQQYTNKDKLFGMGGSAGGLLIGAVINMRPDLFKGVVAGVPFVDVVNTMLDETIPLTTGEFDEWG